MKKKFDFTMMTLALTVVLITLMAAVSVRAQDEEVTSIDDFLEEPSAANTSAENNAPSAGVTQLDELSVETDAEAEQAKQAKKVETVSSIDATELQNTSKSISKAVNTSSGVKLIPFLALLLTSL